MNASRVSAAPTLCAAFATIAALTASAGCAAAPKPFDYGPYLAHMPRSIVVLPPTNESLEVLAPYSCLSTVTRPLAERGYYVFPVALVDAYMKENGLPTPEDMQAVPAAKLREVFGADAALYLHVKGWGTSYQLINSRTTVTVNGRLVDLATGTVIWERAWQGVSDSSGGQTNPFFLLASALVQQIVHTATDASHDVAEATSGPWIADENWGMLVGPMSPGFDADQAKRRAVAGP